ncbi:MAG TPA: hypothetical protein VFU07_09250 [Candidatus Lumbricidophila sp.]|nr:hypothetical protein [Candidatus Lumbricidophila sp.]
MNDRTASESHLLGPGLLATPFTAAEIRDATGAGKTIRIVVDGPGDRRDERVNRFTDCDEFGATLWRWRVPATGAREQVSSARVTWNELQSHAAFPADRTSVTDETLDLPLGRLECRRYDTRETPDAPASTFWFAAAYPGMPVRYEVTTPDGPMRTTILSIERD